MLRVTQDVVEIRRWAESRGATPCRHETTGRLDLVFGGDACALPVGWDEFEPAFCVGHCVFVYDDAPGARRFFVGGADEAHEFVTAEGCASAQ